MIFPKLSKEEFYIKRNSLPLYPEPKNAFIETMKYDIGYPMILIISIIGLPILIPVIYWVKGAYTEIYDHYCYVKDCNRKIKAYYDAIYTSNSYEEYEEKHRKTVGYF